jgi:hypothetical protein
MKSVYSLYRQKPSASLDGFPRPPTFNSPPKAEIQPADFLDILDQPWQEHLIYRGRSRIMVKFSSRLALHVCDVRVVGAAGQPSP